MQLKFLKNKASKSLSSFWFPKLSVGKTEIETETEIEVYITLKNYCPISLLPLIARFSPNFFKK